MVRSTETKKNIKRIGFVGVAAVAAIFFWNPVGAHAASLYLVPANQNLAVGETVVVAVDVSSADQVMNAVSGDISFPTNLLQALSVSENGSIVNLWVRNPSFTNSGATGDVHFEGIVLNPGFTGAAATVMKVTFQAVAAGDATISFSDGSVLANDGNGTDILSSMGTADFPIAPASSASNPGLPFVPIITSLTHPDEAGWYHTTTLQLAWQLPPDVIGVSYAFVSSTQYLLPPRDLGLLSSVTYGLAGHSEGSWYFMIKFRNENGWGPIAIRDVNMDFSPPQPFTIAELSGESAQPLFTWHATDTVSGIKNYMVRIGNGPWTDASAFATSTDEYQMPLQAPGSNIPLAVEAFDEAGNMALATTSFSVSAPSITQGIYCTFSVSVDDLGACGWFGSLLAFFIEWGAFLLVLFLLLVLAGFAVYVIVQRLRMWHLASTRELLKMREELRTDLRRVEKEIEDDHGDANHERIHQEVEHIENDIREDARRLGDGEKHEDH